MRILIGGVPFGRNNVGDEAILECVVRIVREASPGAELTVSTDDGPATAARLGVKTVELFGFEPPYSRARMEEELAAHDAFVWGGATGLSDYPEIPAEMLRIARRAGRRTVMWAVGMNDRLNPAKYRLGGRRRKLLAAASALTGGLWDAVAWRERAMEARARARVAAALEGCDLAVVRDPASVGELRRCGVRREVVVGADSALELRPSPWESARISGDARRFLAEPGPKVGICVSAQRQVASLDRLAALLDSVVEGEEASVVFIPMNPLTDARLMAGLRGAMKRKERACVVEGRLDPGEVLAVASRMDVIASSRLHLLIFASIAHVPVVGISRGSKVDAFLEPFGLRAVGSTEDCDFGRLRGEIARLLRGRAGFEATSRKVREELLARLGEAKRRLAAALSPR
jgi:polysaccharide pyruvyl transferase WcaK-like protein